MKICSKCNIQHTNHHCWCVKCKRTYDRDQYTQLSKSGERRRDQLRERRVRVKKENRQFLYNYLKTHPCLDCGESDPVVLEFDHLRDKHSNVSNMITGSMKKILNEIAKCEVVCSNCHRRRTATRGSWYADLDMSQ